VDDRLEGIAAADVCLGRPFPLPDVAPALVRWSEVTAVGEGGAELELNLDDSRDGTPGRLALYAGHDAPPPHELQDAPPAGRYRVRGAPLAQAQPSLRPVCELSWQDGGLHLRLTAQGPWALGRLVAIADGIAVGGPPV
jgi:hypothetical protein